MASNFHVVRVDGGFTQQQKTRHRECPGARLRAREDLRRGRGSSDITADPTYVIDLSGLISGSPWCCITAVASLRSSSRRYSFAGLRSSSLRYQHRGMRKGWGLQILRSHVCSAKPKGHDEVCMNPDLYLCSLLALVQSSVALIKCWRQFSGGQAKQQTERRGLRVTHPSRPE